MPLSLWLLPPTPTVTPDVDDLLPVMAWPDVALDETVKPKPTGVVRPVGVDAELDCPRMKAPPVAADAGAGRTLAAARPAAAPTAASMTPRRETGPLAVGSADWATGGRVASSEMPARCAPASSSRRP